MSTVQFSLFDDEPLVEVTAKGKRVAAATLKLQPPAQPAAAAKRAQPTPVKPARTTTPPTRQTTLPAKEVPLAPAAQLAVSRIAPLQPLVRVALLELLAVAAIREAEAQRALLPAEAYPFAVTLNVEMLKGGVEGILQSPAVQQAIALNVLCASVPDEPTPEPSEEYLAWVAAEEARKNAPATAPAGTRPATVVASSPSTSQLPADQFGMAAHALTWPTAITPYGKPFKDGKTRPVVPVVLLVGPRDRAYELPRLALATVQYATSQQIRVAFGDGAATERSIQQEGCYCVPTPDHLTRVIERGTAYQTALTALATQLREIGTYAALLREACDTEDGTTPPTAAQLAKLAKANAGLHRLCDQVICAPEPDKRTYTWGDPFKLPEVTRGPIFRHTPLSYQKYQGSATISQGDVFPCVDDATWQRVDAAVKAAEAARTAWVALLAELGTYKVAVTQNRYPPIVALAIPAPMGAPAPVDLFSAFATHVAVHAMDGDASTDPADLEDGDVDDEADGAGTADEAPAPLPLAAAAFDLEELAATADEV